MPNKMSTLLLLLIVACGAWMIYTYTEQFSNITDSAFDDRLFRRDMPEEMDNNIVAKPDDMDINNLMPRCFSNEAGCDDEWSRLAPNAEGFESSVKAQNSFRRDYWITDRQPGSRALGSDGIAKLRPVEYKYDKDVKIDWLDASHRQDMCMLQVDEEVAQRVSQNLSQSNETDVLAPMGILPAPVQGIEWRNAVSTTSLDAL